MSARNDDAAVVDDDAASPTPRPRRAVLRSIAALGLANVALSFLGSKPRADEGSDEEGNDCGKPNEETGGVFKDSACNLPPGKTDLDCSLPDENGEPYSDDRCSQPIPHTPGAWADLDCATKIPGSEKVTKDDDCNLPTPQLPKRHKDSTCGQLVPEFPIPQADQSCAQPSTSTPGGPVHNDSDCGMVFGGAKQKDSDCGLPTTGGVHTDDK